MVRQKDYIDRHSVHYSGSLLDTEWQKDAYDMRVNVHAEKYQKHAARASERQKRLSEEGREIAPLPECADPVLVESCRMDLLKFMLTFGNSSSSPAFPSPFSDAQLYAIRVVQETLLHGGSRPLCLPRGFGKSTICEWGIAWALAYGHQSFILIIAAKTALASQILENVKCIIRQNELFQSCFPALCYPIERLENSPGRAPGQLLNGVHTNIKINSQILICPTVPGAPSSGAIVTTSGLDSAVRGLKVGSSRPTAVIIDDPQTERSAASVTQTEKRWEYLSGAVKGLAGQQTNLSMIATITVIRPDDLSEKILKEWGGQRFGILRSMPKNMDLWLEYDKLRKVGIQHHLETADQIREANEFYLANREAMDEGAEAEWSSGFTPVEHSAIQHAMNLYFASKKAFFSEYQNTPLALYQQSRNLVYEDIVRKIVPIQRSQVPIDCERVTVGIDIQQDCLYWVLCAWGNGFRGHVLDYGRYPGGSASIQSTFPLASELDAFYLALMDLCPHLASRKFQRADGAVLDIQKGLIDANRGLFTPQVRKACFDLASVFEPVFGWGKGATDLFVRGQPHPGEERGDGWQRPSLIPANLVRHTRYDTDYWKSFIRTSWQSPVGGAASLTLFDGDEILHWDFIQQMLSERSDVLEGKRGTIDKWTLIPGRENHLWDGLVMAAVANSITGGHLESAAPATAGLSLYTGNWNLIGR